jgi:hypothetical protein
MSVITALRLHETSHCRLNCSAAILLLRERPREMIYRAYRTSSTILQCSDVAELLHRALVSPPSLVNGLKAIQSC